MSKATIMIVEDEWLIADDLRSCLEGMDYRVSSVVASGEEAIASAEKDRPDLVLMDIILKEKMNGIEAAESIHSRFNIPHIFITAYGDEAMLHKAKMTEPFGYLLKPFDDKELNAAIEMALYKHRMESRLKESEERFKGLVETTSDMIWEVDENAVYKYVSPRIKDMLGYTPEEVLGMKPFDLMPQQEAKRVAAVFGPILDARKEFYRLENSNIHKDGSLVILETSGVPLFDAQGAFRGYRGIDRNITVRKMVEEHVQQKNQLLVNVIESLPHPFYVINTNDYTLALTNSAARKSNDPRARTCYALSHQHGKPCHEKSHPCVLEQIKRTNSPAVEEHIHFDHQGNPVIIEVHGYPIFNKEGNVTQIIEYNLDITDRKKAEDALRESEERYRMLFDKAPLGILHFLKDGTQIDCNDQFAEIIGAPKEKIREFNLVASLQDDKMKAAVQSCLAGKIGHFEGDYVSVIGNKLTPLKADFAPLYSANNTVAGGIGIFEDITERKMVSDALKKEKETLQKYLDISAVMVVMIDRECRVSLINRKGCEILGYEKEDIIGKNWFDNFLPERDRDEVKQVFLELIRGETEPVEYYENPVLTKSGEERMIAWYNTVFRDDNGNIISTLASGGDVTERNKIEQERQRLNTELAHKNKEMEQLVYVTSHDLRTPLAIVQGYAKELEITMNQIVSGIDDEINPSAMKKRMAAYVHDLQDTNRYIRSNIRKMDALLYGLLKLSRSGNIELNIEVLNMNSLIANVYESFALKIKESGSGVEISGLPSCSGDETQINQVFSNLLGNSLKYLDPERPGMIRISGHREGSESVYCVEDNGIGIDPVEYDRIFNIFYRASSGGSGEGLGLTIVKKILERHGGRIWVESEPGKGSRFYVALPAGNEEKIVSA